MDKRFITQINGKDFVLFEGLLDAFHNNGGSEIHTAVVSTDPLIIQATVSGEKGHYQAIGDADETNVNKMVANHKIRMAETRAIARALRLYNNIGMCSAEELGGEMVQAKKSPDIVGLLKQELYRQGAEDEEMALEMIDNMAGVKLNSMSELTNDKAKAIFEFFN